MTRIVEEGEEGVPTEDFSRLKDAILLALAPIEGATLQGFVVAAFFDGGPRISADESLIQMRAWPKEHTDAMLSVMREMIEGSQGTGE